MSRDSTINRARVFFPQHLIMDLDHFASCFEGLSKIINFLVDDTEHRRVGTLHILWFRAFQKMLEALHNHMQAKSDDIVQKIENPPPNQTDLLFIGAAMHLLRDKKLLQTWDNDIHNREYIVYTKWLGYTFHRYLNNDSTEITQRFYEIMQSVVEKHTEGNVWAQLARQKIESNIPPPPPPKPIPYDLSPPPLPKPIPPTFDLSPPPVHVNRSETALLHTQLVNQLLNFSRYRSLEIAAPRGPPLLQGWTGAVKLTDTLLRQGLLNRIEKHALIEREFEKFLIDVRTTVKGLSANNFLVKKLFNQILRRNEKQKLSGKDKWKDLITESMIQNFVDMSDDNVTKLGAAAASFIQNEPVGGIGALVSFTLGNIYSMSDEAALSAIFSAAGAAAANAPAPILM